MFFCEFCVNFKSNFLNWAPLVAASVFWSSFGSSFLVFPGRMLSVIFDIGIDLKMKHI